jgi:hypothetical protein
VHSGSRVFPQVPAQALPPREDDRDAGAEFQHLRQIGLALDQYADLYDGYYLAGSDFPGLLVGEGLITGSTDKTVVTPFICPDYDMDEYASNYTTIRNTYGLNYCFRVNPPLTRNQVMKPSEKALLGGACYQVGPSHIYPTFSQMYHMAGYHQIGDRWNKPAYLDYAHDRRVPGLFVDIHAESKQAPWPDTYY